MIQRLCSRLIPASLNYLLILAVIAGGCGASAPGPGSPDGVATLSFSADRNGSHPGTISASKKITIDLSAIPKDRTVFRAVLRLGRDEAEAGQQRNLPVKITAAGGGPLSFLPPRFQAFDATAAIREAVQLGSGSVSFNVASFPGYRPGRTRLDVTCTTTAASKIPRVTSLRARHQAGQTLLTWTEPDPPAVAPEMTFREWKALGAKLAADPKQVRFRIYRSAAPISQATIGEAELVDEVGPLTCWNPDYFGVYPPAEAKLMRYVVEEGKGPVAPGTAIYAHNPKQAGKAYYAVSMAVNGEEDLTTFDEDNTTKQVIDETVGPGIPVLQRTLTPPSFNYVRGSTLYYYVRWESPPRCNLPSSPYDYLVAEPAARKEPAPVGLHLHCWGGNLEGGYGWWYNAGQGALLISTNQRPYDWWTGYHEHLGTIRSWSEGAVQSYTQKRVMGFLDWAATRWKIDRNRVFSAGSSMGGSGAPSIGIRHADRIAWVVSWVGLHDPARSPHFLSSFEDVYGRLAWKRPAADGETPAFTYFSNIWFLRQNPAADTPVIFFANGKNDSSISWDQARDFWKTLQETRRPHVFIWGQDGHGERAILPGPTLGQRELSLDIRLDQTLPALTNCSHDDNPGNGDPSNGAPKGQSNLRLYWDPASAVDEPAEWGMTLRVLAGAPTEECTVDVTPRRCQKFKPKPGTKLKWTNTSTADKKDVQSGEISVDKWGLATVEKMTVSKVGNRLTLRLVK